MTPKIYVVKFTQDSLIRYHFDKPVSTTPYYIENDHINTGTTSKGSFRFLEKDRFRLGSDKLLDSIDFVRLKPTTTTLTKNEIRKMNFKVVSQGHTLLVNFDQARGGSELTTRLEKIDSTYFLSFYEKGKRSGSFPIELITTKKNVLYGLPEKLIRSRKMKILRIIPSPYCFCYFRDEFFRGIQYIPDRFAVQ